MRRLNIFAKGNVDVHDSLVYSNVNGEVVWNGINELLTERHPDWVARVRHEACSRWDRAGIPQTDVPAELARRDLNLGTMNLESQFRSRVFGQRFDVVVLSIQSDVTNVLRRHRREGYTFLDAGIAGEDSGRWLDHEFVVVGRCTPEESMRSLESIVRALRAQGSPTVLVYNMTPVIPGERIDDYRGLEDAESLRIRAFNAALLEYARKGRDVSLIDVETVIAREGADRLKLDYLHYNRDGYRAIAAEVLRVLEGRGHFD